MKFRPFFYRFVLILLPVLVITGCFQARNTYNSNPLDPLGVTLSGVEYYENPVQIPAGQPEQVWEIVIDVLDDYFEIDHEEPLRQVENFILEGQVETFPRVGATLLEPWRHDSANLHERIESTVQSIRRKALVRVIPNETGYQVEVAVYKQLEDVKKPERSVSGVATFRYDDSLDRVVNPVVEVPIDKGWIAIGRDMVLEQRIIAQILSRTGTICSPCSSTVGQVPMNTNQPATPIPTPAPTQGNVWTPDAGSNYSMPDSQWRPK
ncbi:MAG: hypothetical protein PVH19_03245 [Planctomycetia bacterium]|jgi:hypothetical protein